MDGHAHAASTYVHMERVTSCYMNGTLLALLLEMVTTSRASSRILLMYILALSFPQRQKSVSLQGAKGGHIHRVSQTMHKCLVEINKMLVPRNQCEEQR